MIFVSRAQRCVFLLLRNVFVLINWHCQFPTLPQCGIYYREQWWEHRCYIRLASVNVTVLVFFSLLKKGGSIFLNLNFQVEEAGRNKNEYTYTPLLPLEWQKCLCTRIIITGGRQFGIVIHASFTLFFVFARIIQCFENMQLTTKSFLNFSSVSLCCADVKEQVLLEVVLLVIAHAPVVRARCVPQAQRAGSHRGEGTRSWGRVSPGK